MNQNCPEMDLKGASRRLWIGSCSIVSPPFPSVRWRRITCSHLARAHCTTHRHCPNRRQTWAHHRRQSIESNIFLDPELYKSDQVREQATSSVPEGLQVEYEGMVWRPVLLTLWIRLRLIVHQLNPGVSTHLLHIEPPSPSLHFGPLTCRLHRASSSLRLHLGQSSLCCRHGLTGPGFTSAAFLHGSA